MSRGSISILTACAVLAVAGCGGDGDDSPPRTEPASERTTAASEDSASEPANPDLGRTKPKIVVPAGPPPKELKVKTLIEGTGKKARTGDEVTVQHVGVLYKSGKQLDASWDREEPFTFTLGIHEQINGWDQGLKRAKVGERRRLTIPPELAYGEDGAPPEIAPNETLIFVVDVVAID